MEKAPSVKLTVEMVSMRKMENAWLVAPDANSAQVLIAVTSAHNSHLWKMVSANASSTTRSQPDPPRDTSMWTSST